MVTVSSIKVLQIESATGDTLHRDLPNCDVHPVRLSAVPVQCVGTVHQPHRRVRCKRFSLEPYLTLPLFRRTAADTSTSYTGEFPSVAANVRHTLAAEEITQFLALQITQCRCMLWS